MIKFLAKLFWLDDRTSLLSTSKLIRWLTWSLGSIFTISGLTLVFSNLVVLDDRDIQILNIVRDFLIFFIPTIEGAYQFNRNNKMRNGSAEIVKDETKSIVKVEI